MARMTEREKDHKMVTGVFRYHENEGGTLKFPFKKYKGDPIINYELVDGGTYTIPLMVAKHLNSNCNYPVYGSVSSPDGKNKFSTVSKYHRTSFNSIDFIDTSDSSEAEAIGISPDVLVVQSIQNQE